MGETSTAQRSRLIAVVLAAGEGRRFGGVKQLALLRGVPVLRWSLDAVASHPAVDHTIVVLGAHEAPIREELDLSGIEPVSCAGWAGGPAASLAAGLGAAQASGATAVLITLGDHPGVSSAAIDRVLAAPGPAARALHDGRPGHPVLLRGTAVDEVRRADDEGRKRLLARLATRVETGDVDPGIDVDRPVDLAALERQWP